MPTTGTVSGATGVISMVLLSAVVLLGLMLDRRVRLPGQPRFAGLSLHRHISLLAVAFVALHIVTAVVGPYARIGLAASVIPFTSAYARGWIGLGVVASDLIVAIIITSLLRRRLSHRTWRMVHWLAYACWPAALAHSLGTGGGTRSGALLDLAIGCAVAVLVAAGWRLVSAVRHGAGVAPPPPSGRVRPPLARARLAGFSAVRLQVDPIACTGHGLCAELLPELIAVDQWGYPVLKDEPVPAGLVRRARRTVTDCPALALKLTEANPLPRAAQPDTVQ
jgi:ferredoxin/DMSO/TMAO reductase YedYZ heme-binding membrane subunit